MGKQQQIGRNMLRGRELTKSLGLLDIKKMPDETNRLMRESMGFTSGAVSADSEIKNFSGGEKQGVAIVRALYYQADLIVLDEPTMGLSLQETRKLIEFVQGIKRAGKAAVFIDHNVFHVYNVADRVVVLDRGRVAGEFLTRDITLNELTEKMYHVAETGHLE